MTVNTNSTPRQISKGFSSKKFFKQRNLMDNYYLRGTPTSDPLELAYFCVWVSSFDRSADPAAINLEILIDYSAVWTEKGTEIDQS
jgi:hypothetical protein